MVQETVDRVASSKAAASLENAMKSNEMRSVLAVGHAVRMLAVDRTGGQPHGSGSKPRLSSGLCAHLLHRHIHGNRYKHKSKLEERLRAMKRNVRNNHAHKVKL